MQNDSLRVVKEDVINTYLTKISRELVLSNEQQEQIRTLMIGMIEVQPFNKTSQDLFTILTDKQKEIFLRLIEIDEKSSENIVAKSTLKSTAISTASYTLILDDPSEFIDARLCYNENPSYSYSNDYVYNAYPRDNAVAWTNGGYPMKFRTVLKFVLNDIPIGSEITSATLYFYSDPTQTSSSSADGNSQLSGSNAFYIERITQNWSDQTVTWNNQPSSTIENRLLIPASTSTTENIQIDLTNMVQNWVDAPSYNYGIKMFLQTESYYRSRNYGSMEHANTSIHPKLVVEYDDIQTIEYVYDAAGNRTSQQKIIIPNPLKSAQMLDEDNLQAKNIEPIESNWGDMDITIFPNPTIGNISVQIEGSELSGKILYQIYNSYGVEINNGFITGSGISIIPITSLPSGVYVLTLQINESKKTWKIIKQ